MKPSHRCRQCGGAAELDAANPWRPFCSERCKLLDLGDWFAGRYGIPAESQEDPLLMDEPAQPQPPRHQ